MVSSVTVSYKQVYPRCQVYLDDSCLSSEEQFANIFSAHTHDYVQTTLIRHHINTGDTTPIKLCPHRASPITKGPLKARSVQAIRTQYNEGIL